MKIDSILKSLASIFQVFQPREAIVKEKAEKRDIKNETRKKKHELKRLRLQKKIDRKERKK
jgi:hypothetical protein